MEIENLIKIKSSDVSLSSKLLDLETGKLAIKKIVPSNFEATSVDLDGKYLNLPVYTVGTNNFLLMLQLAFNEHKSVTISPDNIWLLICQGFSQHIKLNKDKFKDSIFGLDEKITIQVRRDDFVKGESNPWEEIFPDFTNQINKLIGKDLYSNIVLDFSTSSLKEISSFEIAFMDSMSSYFNYEFISLCGIPEIMVKGDTKDYNKILTSLQYLRKYNLDWWIDKLIPIIDNFILALEHKSDYEFWSSIYKEHNESGGPFVTGWISNFFPYIKKEIVEVKGIINYKEQVLLKEEILETIEIRDLKFQHTKLVSVLIKNPILEKAEDNKLKLDQFSNGIFKVPFQWKYHDKEYKMFFLSGLIGIKENNNILESEINWVILNAGSER